MKRKANSTGQSERNRKGVQAKSFLHVVQPTSDNIFKSIFNIGNLQLIIMNNYNINLALINH